MALLHNGRYSFTDEGKVYHAIQFGEEFPNYRPSDDDMPDDKPGENDQRFSYHTEVKLWPTCQVREERTLRVATDKVDHWVDVGQLVNPTLNAIFPASQKDVNQAKLNRQADSTGSTTAKGDRKRPSSVPPDSDTARAKQAKAQAEVKGAKGGAGKGSIPSIPKQELSAIAATIEARVKKAIPSLKPKHYRTILNLASEWYKALYHTVFHMTKPEYLEHLYLTAVGNQRAKERDPNDLDLFIKALEVLKKSVDDPTTVGLSNPLTARAQSAQPKGKGKSTADSYAAAITGKSSSTPPPTGAKVQPKAKEKVKSVTQPSAIGAPIKGTAKAKSKTTQPHSGPQQGAAKQPRSSVQSDDNITADSALEFMTNSPATQSFMEYQQEKSRQTALEAQAAQDAQTAQALQAELDAQAAGDTPATQGAQDTGSWDLDEEDEAIMQRTLALSRQEAQAHEMAQGSDPTASSSAAPGRTIEDDIEYELQLGRDFQREAAALEAKMTTNRLTTDELGRLRQLNQLQQVNRDRVVELCERQAQQHQTQQAKDIRRMLGSLKPLQPAIGKAKPAVSKEKSKQPAIVKEYPGVGRVKVPPPKLPPLPPPAVIPSRQQQVADPPDSNQGPPPDSIPNTRFTSGPLPPPMSPKRPASSRSQQGLISPKGQPPPRIAVPPLPIRPAMPTDATTATPKSTASINTADLEYMLKKRKEAKRSQPDTQEEGLSVMVSSQSNSGDLIIMMMNIAQVEIVDGKGDLQEMNLLPLHLKKSRMVTIGHSPLVNLDPADMNTRGAIGLGHVVK